MSEDSGKAAASKQPEDEVLNPEVRNRKEDRRPFTDSLSVHETRSSAATMAGTTLSDALLIDPNTCSEVACGTRLCYRFSLACICPFPGAAVV